MCVSTTDTRGLDLYPSLYPVNDTVAAITSITVSRLDNLPLEPGDLLITPTGFVPPWISANLAGVPAMAINWWQGVGALAQISPSGCAVDYLITVSFVTAAGRPLTYTATQLVSPVLG
jgi:hypothetical protein